MKYKLAIFDMDGTILDTLEDLTDAVNHTLIICGYPTRSIDEVRNFVGNGIAKLIERAVPDGCSASEIDKAYKLFLPFYQEHSSIKTKPYAGINALLHALKQAGCKTAVVSNKADPAVKVLAEQYFPGLFDIAVGEQKGIRRKPAPDEVDIVLDYLNINKKDAVYIGDSDVDVATARASSLDLIAVDWGFRSRSFLEEQNAEIIVSSPSEIEAIILQP